MPGLKEAYIMDKEKNTRLPLVDLIEVKPMQDGYRWVAISASSCTRSALMWAA